MVKMFDNLRAWIEQRKGGVGSPLVELRRSLDDSGLVCSCSVECHPSRVLYDYVFVCPVSLSFSLSGVGVDDCYEYEGVTRLVVIDLLNVFVECLVGVDGGVERFYILNNVTCASVKVEK